MLTRELEQRIAEWSSRPLSDLDLRSRSLRGEGMLPVAGRGPYAAKLTAQHVKNYLLGLASPKASGAAEFVKLFDGLKPLRDSFPAPGALGRALGTILSAPEVAAELHSVILSRAGGLGPPRYFARILWRRPEEKAPRIQWYVPGSYIAKLQEAGGDDWSMGVSLISDDVAIGGAWLAQVAFALAHGPIPSGWRAPVKA